MRLCPPRGLPLFALSLLGFAGCSSGGSPTEPGGNTDPPPTDPPAITNTVTIGTSGGTVELADGTAVVFPAGAVSGPLSVTLAKVTPSTWFDGSDDVQRAVVSTTAAVTQFAQDVQIRVPLPAGMSQADSGLVLAGVIDESTGAVTVERSEIQIQGGKPFLVVKTNHFTQRLYEWLVGKVPPASAGPLPIPYYNQGESNYCWATSLQMVTRAVRQDDSHTIPQIIGRVGVDEGGITSIGFRLGSAISTLVRDRTGVRPTRQTWDYINVNNMKDYLKREIGVHGRPVALFNGTWNHAVVVVGYDGNTFYIHDPASTSTSAAGYTSKTWTDITGNMGVLHNMVTLVVPSAPAATGSVRVNALPRAFEFTKPSTGPSDPSAIYEFRWDYTDTRGYAFRHKTHGDVASPLPGAITTLSFPGDFQISNASRTSELEVSVWLDITAMGAPTGVGRYSAQKTLTLPANAVKSFQPDPIKVDTFRHNKATPTEYLLSVTALVGGTTVDKQSLVFTVGGVTPEITGLSPSTAAVGQTVRIQGSGFGQLKLNNKVTFNGVVAPDILSWADDAISVKVPLGASSGPVVVTRGEVASNGVPFTLQEYLSSQSFDLTWGNKSNAFQVKAHFDVSAVSAGGGWRSVFEERSAFNPMDWVKLYFGTVAPAAGGSNSYQIDVRVDEVVSDAIDGTITVEGYRWVERSQTANGLPTSEVLANPYTITEQDSWFSKSADLYIKLLVKKDGTADRHMEAPGFMVSFHPGHVGMRVSERR